MPTFVKSAMNPNGTWQSDGMDQVEMGNRAHQTQMQGRDLQAQLALAQLQNQRYGVDKMADMTRQGWDREDSRRSSDMEKAIAVARIGKEMGEGERLNYERAQAFDNDIRGMLGIGQPSAGSAGPASPGASAASAGALDPDMLKKLAIFTSLKNGTAMPDIAGQDMRRQATELELGDRKRDSARDRMRVALEAGDVAGAKAIAAETGESLPLGRIEDFMAQNPGMTSGLGDMVGSFVDRDSDTFGWDPGEQDIKNIKDEFDRIVQSLTSRGFPPELAMQEAMRAVRMKLGGDANDINAGWTQTLLSRLGMGGYEAPQVPIDPGAM